jgi:Second Messenger Oligonucleotide or Dinucleotide Synthetase domain
MMTVAQAFEDFRNSLELKEGEAEKATRQQQDVFQKLQQSLRPTETLLSGSYGRSTAIRPLHDIDLFLVLPPPRPLPTDALKNVQRALQHAYQGKQPQLQNRSVNIEFKDTGIGFDVVPAFKDPGQPDVYWIPERDSSTWIPSNPRRHKEVCNEADKRTSQMLRPLVKMLKRWNHLQGRPVPSFLLEVMVYEGLTAKPASFASGLATLVQFMSERIQRNVPEPAKVGAAVDARLSSNHREQARQRLGGAARRAAQALERENAGDVSSAHAIWRELLGPDYPGR